MQEMLLMGALIPILVVIWGITDLLLHKKEKSEINKD